MTEGEKERRGGKIWIPAYAGMTGKKEMASIDSGGEGTK
jgi:hypothetical protein